MVIYAYSIKKTLLEVYKTDEENFVPYTPLSGDSEEEETSTTDEETTEDTTTAEDEDEDALTDGFSLHQGEILETYYYNKFTNVDYDSDYEDISDSGSISIPEQVDLSRFYKGVRLAFQTYYEEYGKVLNFDGIPIFVGFITEETFNEDGMELKLSGMTKLLEQKYEFNFTQMKISEILTEMIKTAGLKPAVDPTGLDDKVIDYTNVSSDGDDDSGVDNSNLPADACKFAKQLTKGKSGDRAKAQAIYDWIWDNCPYNSYLNSRFTEQNVYQAAKEHIGEKTFNCCDHAHLSVVLLRCVGIKANYVHGPWHVWAVAYLDGSKVQFDALGTQSKWSMGNVWHGLSGTEMESINF